MTSETRKHWATISRRQAVKEFAGGPFVKQILGRVNVGQSYAAAVHEVLTATNNNLFGGDMDRTIAHLAMSALIIHKRNRQIYARVMNGGH